MKILSNLLKDIKDEWLVRTTASINEINPIVDRIMDDDSVKSVIMTNKEGAPILTNVTLVNATHYGKAMHKLGNMAQIITKEFDPFDEVLALRVNTKRFEIITTPHKEFSVTVVQQARQAKDKLKKKNNLEVKKK